MSPRKPITEEERTLWVDALRSGDYPQGRDMLRDRGSYCCLGVLNEIARLGFPGGNGYLGTSQLVQVKLGPKTQYLLSTLNDDGTPFVDIAARIEGMDLEDLLK